MRNILMASILGCLLFNVKEINGCEQFDSTKTSWGMKNSGLSCQTNKLSNNLYNHDLKRANLLYEQSNKPTFRKLVSYCSPDIFWDLFYNKGRRKGVTPKQKTVINSIKAKENLEKTNYFQMKNFANSKKENYKMSFADLSDDFLIAPNKEEFAEDGVISDLLHAMSRTSAISLNSFKEGKNDKPFFVSNVNTSNCRVIKIGGKNFLRSMFKNTILPKKNFSTKR